MHCTLIHCTVLRCTYTISVNFTMLYCTEFHYILRHFTTLYCTVLHYISLHYTALYYITLHRTTWPFTVINCYALHWTRRPKTTFKKANIFVKHNKTVTKSKFTRTYVSDLVWAGVKFTWPITLDTPGIISTWQAFSVHPVEVSGFLVAVSDSLGFSWAWEATPA